MKSIMWKSFKLVFFSGFLIFWLFVLFTKPEARLQASISFLGHILVVAICLTELLEAYKKRA